MIGIMYKLYKIYEKYVDVAFFIVHKSSRLQRHVNN